MAAVTADPWSTGLMGMTSVATAALKPASSGAQQTASSVFDNSGFVVNVGAGSASSSKTALPSASQVAGAVASSAGSLLSNPVFIIGVGVALFLFLKHK